jgi:hypothetical protein
MVTNERARELVTGAGRIFRILLEMKKASRLAETDFPGLDVVFFSTNFGYNQKIFSAHVELHIYRLNYQDTTQPG